MTRFDHAHQFQAADRVAYGAAADAKRFCEFAFGRKFVAGLEFFKDEALDLLGDAFVNFVAADGFELVDAVDGSIAAVADVVVTDHHRPELGPQLRDALAARARWVGIMGNPRVEPPHVAALTELGVPADEISKVHRPIGVNIGSRTPAEIAISTIAGLIADRNGKPGGFTF